MQQTLIEARGYEIARERRARAPRDGMSAARYAEQDGKADGARS